MRLANSQDITRQLKGWFLRILLAQYAFSGYQRTLPVYIWGWICASGKDHSRLVLVSYFLGDKCLSHLCWRQIDWSQLGQTSNIALILPACSNPSNYRVILSSTCCSLHFSKLYTDWIPLWEEWDLDHEVTMTGINKVILQSANQSWSSQVNKNTTFKIFNSAY